MFSFMNQRLGRAALWQTMCVLAGFVGMLVVIVAYARSAAEPGSFGEVFGLLAVFALAAVTVGSALGFLFGIPRARAVAANGQISQEATFTPGSSLPNTNLEQISDWLTKILVGATLVQLGNIPAAASQLFTSMASGLATGPSATAFVGSLVVFGATFGFMFGWLSTRAWVARMLTAADDDNGDVKEDRLARTEVQRRNAVPV